MRKPLIAVAAGLLLAGCAGVTGTPTDTSSSSEATTSSAAAPTSSTRTVVSHPTTKTTSSIHGLAGLKGTASSSHAVVKPTHTTATHTTATHTTTKKTTHTTTSHVPVYVHAGAFCSPEGATGVTSTGTPMVCSIKAGDTRARWRKA
jgi:hypothetical protein